MVLLVRGNLVQTFKLTHDGNVTAPSLTFASAPQSGMYQAGNGNVGISVNGAQQLIVSETGVQAQGNVSGTFILGNGSLLTGLPATNNASFLTSGTLSNALLPSNISVNGNVAGTFILGNGSLLTGLPATTDASLLSTGTLNNALLPSNISVNGNVAGLYFIGNGSQLTGLPATNNASLLTTGTLSNALLPSNISVNGNVAGSFILGNGSLLTGLPATNNASFLTTGTLSNALLPSNISVNGNVAGTFILGNGSLLTGLPATNNASFLTTGTLSNALLPSNISVNGNVSGSFILGNGSLLTGLPATTDANLLSTGTLSNDLLPSDISVNGNVAGTFILGNGSLLTGLPATNNASLLTTGTLSNDLLPLDISVNGNVSGSYFLGNGSLLTGLPATNNASFLTTGTLSNALLPSNISVNGNVAGSFILGNGSLLTGLPATNNASLLTTGTLSNALLPSNISVNGNLSGSYVLGNGAFLTGVQTSGNVDANVVLTGGDIDAELTILDGMINADLLLIGGMAYEANVGNVTNPGYAFDGNVSTGLYMPTANTLGFSISGVEQMRLDANGMTTTGNVSAAFVLGNGSFLTGVAQSPPVVTNVQITNSTFQVLDDTAVSTTGGYVRINGTNFGITGSRVFYGGPTGIIPSPATTHVSATQIHAIVPGFTAGSYDVMVYAISGAWGMLPSGLTASPFPLWTTSGTLTSVKKTKPFSLALTATADSNVAYSLDTASVLPPGTTLTSNGVLSGNIVDDPGNATTYSFNIQATDLEYQNFPRTFTLQARKPAIEDQISKLLASDAATSDQFGIWVSISADGATAIVGAGGKSSYTGAAYIYKTTNGTTWTQISKLTASDAATSDYFGSSVSISADGATAIVGAGGKSSYTGAAYIYKTTNGTTWTQISKLTASDAATNDYFGISVSISADGATAIVGAYNKNSATGAAYIYKTTNGTTWTQISKMTASDAATNDYFGYSVSISADGATAIVGAYGKNSITGAAYIYKTTNGTTWTQISKVTASDAATNDRLGISVSISADGATAIVGAYNKNSGFTGQGAAYVYKTTDGTTWTQISKVTASDAATNDQFGWSVSISADGATAIVGAYYKNSGFSGQGAAYVFETANGTTWTQISKVTASDAATNDQFGYSVSISADGGTTIIGAYGKSSYAGAAYIFK